MTNRQKHEVIKSYTDEAHSLTFVESGTFRGGACVVHEQRVILINRSMPIEAAAVILARALARFVPDDQFMKPAVRDLIDREQAYLAAHPDVTFAPHQPTEEAA